ncbi:alpha-farnesene synthase-like [Rhodamnia argentea]|uniref:Alpha-farnesene synthase-like n=1 Tax=Rhodamnia argentea TaxID=178133 RepID=A0ABM3HXW1_9MYRT|nr:alpha-farnesene synthase-like [Rhodamnia argentea]
MEYGTKQAQFRTFPANSPEGVDPTHQRRSANYKPNIWNYDFLRSLNNKHDIEEGIKERVEQLVEDVKLMFAEAVDSLAKLEMIDRMRKMGLSNLFGNEMKETLETVASTNYFTMEDHVYASALRFRLLRQYGYVGSQDALRSFKEGSNTLNRSNCKDIEAMIELFEASHLALEGENILDEAKAFSTGILGERVSGLDGPLSKRAVHSLELPMHWRVQWFDIKWQINLYEQQEDKRSNLLELAKLNFNTVQATHQRDLVDISRWWRDLGLIEHVDFTRDRPVESFLYALGLAQEPQLSSLRKSLSKVVILILVIDDVYDLCGSLEELECFTGAIIRWDSEQIQQLPECMKVCFRALRDVTYEIAYDITKDEDWHRVLPHLAKAWADFCKALLTEAKWDHSGYTPSLEEYLSNAWTSSSGPLLLSHAYFFVGHMKLEDVADLLEKNKDLIYNVSMIIRLCNDLRTSKAEIDRGDAPSSVMCYMREVHVSEDVARKHIKVLINQAWKSISSHCFGNTETPFLRPFTDVTVNAARAAHMLYQFGDGFGIQDGSIGKQILSTVIEPLALD